jgi:hypothetical protein
VPSIEKPLQQRVCGEVKWMVRAIAPSQSVKNTLCTQAVRTRKFATLGALHIAIQEKESHVEPQVF